MDESVTRLPGNRHEKTRQIIVTGGVVSSLGKGLTAASLGMLLRARGLNVAMQKLDPYLNVDPGTMNPFQHGEVFVTEDGAETDLDIGHYERFLDTNLTGRANTTTGQVYSSVIARERAGDYLGGTVQVIPHITDEIQSRMRAQAEEEVTPDVIITEIGGTVGDIESLPFLEAARQLIQKLGRSGALVIHVSLVPRLAAAGELKTKPTQHSVAQLRSLGIAPDVVVLRCEEELPEGIREKISMMCGVELEGVIQCPDAASIYDIPQTLHGQGLDAHVVRRLDLAFRDVDWRGWDDLITRVHEPKRSLNVGIVGKYIDLRDAYLSVSEALRAGGFAHEAEVNVTWVASDDCLEDPGRVLGGLDAIIVPGGFGVRGIEGKIAALRYAREAGLPTLGICLGMQSMVIEAARSAGLDASSTEFDPGTEHPVITTMAGQEEIVAGAGELGGTMRLGAFPATLREGSVVARAYGTTSVSERHRHRYEVNPDYIDRLEQAGLIVSGTSPDGSLVEYVEDPKHPYYVGCQAHPEFMSRPTRPHPLFAGLIEAALR